MFVISDPDIHHISSMKSILEKFDFQSDKIISSLSPQERALFRAKAEPLIFKAGQLIFYEGGIPTGVFLMISGKAKIYKVGLDGKEQIFYIYKAHDLLGYHALLCDEHYEDACEVLEDSELLFVRKSQFEQLLDQIPKLRQLIIQNISHEFGVMVNTITVLAQKTVRERLALFLLLLHHKYQTDDHTKPRINLPREDLANIIGTARESLGRLIKDFKEEGLIEVNKRQITLLDQHKIQKIAGI